MQEAKLDDPGNRRRASETGRNAATTVLFGSPIPAVVRQLDAPRAPLDASSVCYIAGPFQMRMEAEP